MFEITDVPPGRHSRLRRVLVGAGWTLLIPSVPWLLLGMLGFAPTDFLAIGASSGLRTLASAAVAGCLLAAIGYWDD